MIPRHITLAMVGWMILALTSCDPHGKELRRLLGPTASGWPNGARIVAWQPDLNYKPQSYYFLREVDEAGFRRMVAMAGLSVAPASAAVVDAVWRLPDGIRLNGWSDTVPAGGALQAHGHVGAAAVWLRWAAGRVSFVVEQASP